MDKAEPRLTTHRLDELRPHPSYVKHQLPVAASKISALVRLGNLAFLDPIGVNKEGIIIDGYARWDLAKSRGLTTISCLEYDLTADEALCCLLQKHRRHDELNDFTRIRLALDLEPSLREKARQNQQAGGRWKGSSTLTEAGRVDVRRQIAEIAGVSVGNVTKVKRILAHADSSVQCAARCREISINLAERWSHESSAQQLENLRVRRFQCGIKKKAKYLVSAHVSKLRQCEPDLNVRTLLSLVERLATMSPHESDKLGPVVTVSVDVPGKAILVTEELLQALWQQP